MKSVRMQSPQSYNMIRFLNAPRLRFANGAFTENSPNQKTGFFTT